MKEGSIRSTSITEDLQSFVSQVYDHFESSNNPIQWKFQDKRSLDANAQFWVWVPKIAEFMGWTIKETGTELKLDHGLHIILADPEYGPKIKFVLDKCEFQLMSREQQLGMVDFLPVTRLFSTKQHNSYRDSIQVHFARQGLDLGYLNE